MSGYVESLNRLLAVRNPSGPLVVDLFAGCGGLALGFEAAGFVTHGFEMDADCCATYSRNLLGDCTQVVLTTQTPLPEASMVIGGPPCQPFSVGGKQLGLSDSRDGFPIFISAIRRLRPKLWILENVRGLFYRNRSYLHEIVTELGSLGYQVDVQLLNAVGYGVPQNRERVFLVGHTGGWKFPNPSSAKVTAGEALGDFACSIPDDAKFLTPSMDRYIAKYERASKCIRPRDLHLDAPARTLTCRNLAGATGDMHRIRLPDGRRRRLSVREAARLQSFPDWFEFRGGETSRFNQIGNAVPPMFSMRIAKHAMEYISCGSINSASDPSEMHTKQIPLFV